MVTIHVLIILRNYTWKIFLHPVIVHDTRTNILYPADIPMDNHHGYLRLVRGYPPWISIVVYEYNHGI